MKNGVAVQILCNVGRYFGKCKGETIHHETLRIMILPFDQEAQFKAASPAFGRECASVLFQRGMIAENDRSQVATVIGQWAGSAELIVAVAELAQRHLITPQNRAATAEFMKRVARRLQLSGDGLPVGVAIRNRGDSRLRAYRVLKKNSLLTADRLTTLVTRLVDAADKPAA